MQNDENKPVRPEIYELIKLGDKFGSRSFKGKTKEEIGVELRQMIADAKKRIKK